MLNTFILSMRWLWRDWRAREWMVVFFALLLAVTAMTSLNFYTDRLLRGLEKQNATFLGGDLVLTSPFDFPQRWRDKANRLKLQSAEVWSYPSVISANNQLQLVTIQAVSRHYPLLSQPLALSVQSAVVSPRLLPLLSLKMEDKIAIGAAPFRIKGVIASGIDLLNSGWLIAPSVFIRLEDVAITKTVIPGSRVEYRLLLVGDTVALKEFRTWILPQLTTSQKLLDVRNQQGALFSILEKMQNYVQLVLLVAFLLSGVAIALSIQQYVRRHYASIALWRSLGAKETQIVSIIICQLVVIALFAGLLGIGAGYVLQAIFSDLFTDLFSFPLPPVSLSPVMLGISASFLLLFLFSYSLVTELPYVSPLALWRRETKVVYKRNHLYLLSMMTLLILFLFIFMHFSILTLLFIDIILLSAGFLYAMSLFILGRLRTIKRYTNGSMARGISQLVEHPETTSLQFVGLTLVLMALFVLQFIRVDILQDWQASLPAHSPNYFAFNIASADLQPLQSVFKQHQIRDINIYPMVRGRLMAVNGKPVMSVIPADKRNINALHRELNLSWMWHFPTDNKLISGPMWAQADKAQPYISVEKKLSEDLQLKIGDRLSFKIGDETVTAQIFNIRSVEWTSFHPNFYVIFVPGFLDHFSSTFITSFHLNRNQEELINQLVKQFPNMTVIDLSSLLQQILSLMNKVSLALQYLFFFSLGAGVLILMSSIEASMDERRETAKLLRVLGANRFYIYKSTIVEFISLSVLILSSSLALAWLIASLLRQWVVGF